MIAKKQKLAEELFHPKNFSEKQNKFLNDSYAKINLLSGAIQSGKTHIANLRFAKYVVLESEYDRFMINGNNLNSIYRNVIDNGFLEIMQKICGKDRVGYKGTYMWFEWLGEEKKIWVIGIKDKGAYNRLKGAPVGGTYADEFSTYEDESGKMAFARNSLENAIILGTTNPGVKTNWAYLTYLSNKDLVEKKLLRMWNFTLKDNPSLSETTKQFYINSFTGIFYRWNILGEWASPEGAIYDRFNADYGYHKLKKMLPISFDDAFLCFDYGAANVTTFALWYVKINPNGNNYYYCVGEFYYNVKDEKNGKIEKELVGQNPESSDANLQILPHKIPDIVLKWLEGCSIFPSHCFIDPSAVDLINYMSSKEVFNPVKNEWVNPFDVYPAYNKVSEGLSRIGTLIAQRNMQWHESCWRSFNEYEDYKWDDKNEGKPIKENDHACDRDRYGIMSYEKYGFEYNIDKNINTNILNMGFNLLNNRG